MLVVFALILLVGGLIGVVNPRWVKMGSRKQATLALVLGVIILVFTLPADTTTTESLVEYAIEARQDLSVAGMPRYTYMVTVPEGATEGQMMAVAKAIVESPVIVAASSCARIMISRIASTSCPFVTLIVA